MIIGHYFRKIMACVSTKKLNERFKMRLPTMEEVLKEAVKGGTREDDDYLQYAI